MEIPAETLDFIIPELHFLICGLILLYLAGLKDDLTGLRYRSKFIIQIFAVCMLPISGLWINNLYGLFGIHELSPWIGIPFTLFVAVYIINSINLIDGLDGLASGLANLSLCILGIVSFYYELWIYAILAFATLGTLIPFFLYNVFGKAEHCKKIFMGDTGSLVLGYLLAFLIIRYSYCQPEIISHPEKAFIISFSTILVPVFDVCRVMLFRLRKGKHIFMADTSHIHHKLLSIGFTPRKAMVSILGMSVVFWVTNTLLLSRLDINMLFGADIVIWIGLNLWLDKLRDNKGSRTISGNLKK